MPAVQALQPRVAESGQPGAPLKTAPQGPAEAARPADAVCAADVVPRPSRQAELQAMRSAVAQRGGGVDTSDADTDSDSDTDTGDVVDLDSESDDDLGPCPTTAAEAAQYVLDAAGRLERSASATRDTGVAQLTSVVDSIISGTTSPSLAANLARVWLSKDNAVCSSAGLCGSAVSAAKKLSCSDVPQTLCVHSPERWAHCSGCYSLEELPVNGQPHWGTGNRSHFLYSTPSGKWRVTNDANDFSQGGGYFLSQEPHQGASPHLAQAWTAKGVVCDLTVSAAVGEAVRFADDDGDSIEVFASVSGSRANGCSVQYAVNGEPRQPTGGIRYDSSESSLDFPELATSIRLQRGTAHAVVASLKQLLASHDSAVCAELPEDPLKLYLALWRVCHNAEGRPYYYHEVTRQSTWDICTHLDAVQRS